MSTDRWTPTLILIVLCIQTALLGLLVVKTNRLEQRVAASATLPPGFTPEQPQRVDDVEPADGPTLGPDDAPVTIVAFSDFTCPACATLDDTLPATLAERDDVRVVFRFFPLADRDLPLATALAAECARRQDAFWPMHDLLFERQGRLEEAAMGDLATEIGLDLETFGACMAADDARRAVLAHRDADLGYGVDSTQTLFVNGWKVKGAPSPRRLGDVIDRALAERAAAGG